MLNGNLLEQNCGSIILTMAQHCLLPSIFYPVFILCHEDLDFFEPSSKMRLLLSLAMPEVRIL